MSKETTLLHSPSDPQLEADTQTLQAGPQSFLFCCQMCTKKDEKQVTFTYKRNYLNH